MAGEDKLLHEALDALMAVFFFFSQFSDNLYTPP